MYKRFVIAPPIQWNDPIQYRHKAQGNYKWTSHLSILSGYFVRIVFFWLFMLPREKSEAHLNWVFADDLIMVKRFKGFYLFIT